MCDPLPVNLFEEIRNKFQYFGPNHSKSCPIVAVCRVTQTSQLPESIFAQHHFFDADGRTAVGELFVAISQTNAEKEGLETIFELHHSHFVNKPSLTLQGFGDKIAYAVN